MNGPVSTQAAKALAGAANVAIVRIEAIPLKVKLERDAVGSNLKFTHRHAVVTRIHTDAGVVGECFNGNDDALQPAIVRMIVEEMAPKLVGRRVVAVEEAWAMTRVATEPFLRDRRVALRAQACIDSALHDAVGKLAGLPLHTLWGSARTEVPAIVLGGYYRDRNELEELADEVRELKASGAAGIKLKVGGRTPEQDAERARAVRRAGGDDFILACDANQGWTRADAIAFAQRVSDLDLRWYEEPCKWDNDREDMAAVRKATGLKISAGQSELSSFGCRDLMKAGAIDICNFDASWGGGPTEWWRMAALAESMGIGVCQHIEPQIGAMMVAAAPTGTFAEMLLPWRDPFFLKLIADQKPMRNGRYPLPTRPGWGMVFDEDYFAFARRKD
ncbi:MAG TPA: mandelate racemase/muconate lactonizing enzyme family protein [Xanthobacteraceae bacterium]|nr:mandelate racemase/muconate lactonizing enzyme family protein [Xanthobacteraceae bacterium]